MTLHCPACLFSAGAIKAGGGHGGFLDLFAYCRSMRVPGADVGATPGHTNLPRGDCMPQGWSLIVRRLWFLTDRELGAPLVGWLNKGAMVRLRVNNHDVCEYSLAEALRAESLTLALAYRIGPLMAYRTTLELPAEPLPEEAVQKSYDARDKMAAAVDRLAGYVLSGPGGASTTTAWGRRMLNMASDLCALRDGPSIDGAVTIWVVLEGEGDFEVI